MNITKALKVAAEYRAEGKKWIALADEIEFAVRRAGNGSRFYVGKKKRGNAVGYLAAGIDVLREAGCPMHVNEMLPKMIERVGKDVTRANAECAMVRGLKQGKITRPRPSTFALI